METFEEEFQPRFGYAKVGDIWPDFELKGVDSSNKITDFSYKRDFAGKWFVAFFWPKDFTFVCPTELKAFNSSQLDASVAGFSIDSEFVHLNWKKSLDQDIHVPMISDIRRDLVNSLGIADPTEGVAQRATFIIDPDGIIRFVSVTDMKVGRSVAEVKRVLAALKSDGLCPATWQEGDSHL